ncbi:aldo/keto reductase [Prauserella halophila]|uniref:Aldo/keto reductase n=1 Tax=Prauserella halophila TaxID=185641 RepID=A0ABN1W008_9PSEU|nr:aldo/keto reductase [Prauserella halophila]MCP2235291.1 putative oxidoreductase [Prauserella halophila]
MRYRLFGRTGLRVSELFLGAMRLPDAPEARRIVDAYADAGGNVIDTASAYGDSESLLGEVLTRRDRFVLATKFTLSRDPGDPNAAGAHRKNLVASLDRSLRRLRTDHVDILWVHTWDPHTPVEETLRALDDLVRAGKIRYVGMSDMPAWTISRADAIAEWKGWTSPAGVQVPYSLVNRDIEREVLPMAEALGLTVAAWGVLDHGALTGSASTDRLSPAGERAAAALADVAGELGATPGQVAIAWSRAQSPAIHPLVGFRSHARVAEAVAALDVRLPDEALAALDAAAPFDAGPYADFVARSARDPHVMGDAEIVGRRAPTAQG